MRAAGVRVGAAVLAAVVALLGCALAGSAPAEAAPAVRAEAPVAGVTLLGQSGYVRPGHVLTLHLGIPASERGRGQLRMAIAPALLTRTGFDAAAAGNVDVASTVWSAEVPLTGPSTRGAEVTLHIPVGMAPTGSQLPDFPAAPASGVFPLQIQLEDPIGASVGPALTTFLVEDAGTGGFQRLTVALTVPLPDATPSVTASPTAGTVAALARELAPLSAHPGVPVTISVQPSLLASIGAVSGGSAVQAAVADLVARGDELLPSTWADADVPAMVAGGLGALVADQIATGTGTETAVVHRPIGTGTWVVSGYDPAGLRALVGLGLHRLVVPASELSPLPPALTQVTYGLPVALAGAGTGVQVVGADPVLSARTVQRGGAVLAAEQTLAEVAMTQLERPGEAREVAIVPPGGLAPSAAYLSTLLAGLRDDPFAQPATTAGLFSRFPTATVSSEDRANGAVVPVQHLTTPPADPLPGAAAILGLEADAASIATVVPDDPTLAAELRQVLLLAPSARLSAPARAALLASAEKRIAAVEHSVAFPGSASVTLTSLSARLPLTLVSRSTRPLHVILDLSSPKLAFLAYRPPGPDGSCTSSQRGEETCRLVLATHQTTLKLPVESRTSGVFTLQIGVRSPDGRLRLASERETIRSTAVSFVGIIIIVLALSFLGLWWIRDLRSGRRARELVDRPEEDLDGEPGDDNPDGGGTRPDRDAGPPTRPAGGRPLPRPAPVPAHRVPAGVGTTASRSGPRAPVTILSSRRSHHGRQRGGPCEEPRP